MSQAARVTASSSNAEVVETFQDEPLSRWSAAAGNWEAEDKVQIADVRRTVIYRSREEPSHVAWAGLWREADGSIKVRFPELTGNPGLEPSYGPWYGRNWMNQPGYGSWSDFCKALKMREGPSDAIETTGLAYVTMVSRDGGITWDSLGPGQDHFGCNSKPVLAPDGSPIDGGMSTIVCRDGRVVQTIGLPEYLRAAQHPDRKYLLGIRESTDSGKTWSDAQLIIPDWQEYPLNRWTEENSIVELEDGRILVLIRTDGIETGVAQVCLTRTDSGTYGAGPTIETVMPHSGRPDLVKSSDGTIWYWDARGHYYTVDEGETWQLLPAGDRFPNYYGKMIEGTPNQILCVTQQGISDSPYPHYADAYIEGLTFSHRRGGVMKQTDASAPLALIRMNEGSYRDLHVRVDANVDKAPGVAFHVSPDGQSFYAFAVIMPGTEAYSRWAYPAMQEEVLSAWHPGLLEAHAPDDRVLPIIALARVDRGEIKALRGQGIACLKEGEWLQLQVKVKGDLIQAAVNRCDDPVRPSTYIGARDSTYREGGIGLLTDGGLGEFTKPCVWSTPQMIRDLWSRGSLTRTPMN